MAQKYQLKKHQPKKALYIGLIATLLQSLLQLIMVNGDIFSMDWKAAVNSLVIGSLSYLVTSFVSDERVNK